MPASPIASNTFALAGSIAGVVLDLGSAPAAGQVDTLLVVSNGVIQMPGDFSTEVLLNNAASTLAWRTAAGNPAEQFVTVTTPQGAVNLLVRHVRWTNVDAFTVVDSAMLETPGQASPVLTTGVLPETDQLVVLALGMIGFSSAPTAPAFSASYTDAFPGDTTTFGGTGSDAVGGWFGYNATAGTPAESPSVTWSSNVTNRYGFVLAFTSGEGPAEVTLTPAVTVMTPVALDPVPEPGEVTLTPVVTVMTPVPLDPEVPAAVPSVDVDLMNFGPALEALLTCVCAALAEVGRPVCSCALTIGPPAWSDCGCVCDEGGVGQLSISVVTIGASSSFPQILNASDQYDRACPPAYLVAQLAIEIARCVPTVTDSGQSPTPATLTATALDWLTDVTAIRQAVGCCLAGLFAPPRSIARWTLGTTIPVPEQGGCAGSVTSAYIALPNCVCPS